MKDKQRKNIIEGIIFFGIAFGVNYLVGISMYFTRNVSANVVSGFIVLLPVTGAYLAQYYRNQKKHKGMWVILIYESIMFLAIAGALAFPDTIRLSEDTMGAFLSFVMMGLLVYLLVGNGWTHFLENGGLVHKDLLILFLLLLVRDAISLIPDIAAGNGDHAVGLMYGVMEIPGVFLSIVMFYGEEYGWRAYLQGKFQRRCGKRLGVVLLGIIWFCWHIPLWLTQGDKVGELIVFGLPLIIGVSAFLGYIYMRTKNAWLCAIGHGIYNAMGLGEGTDNMLLTNIVSLLFGLILCLYLLKKEYRE